MTDVQTVTVRQDTQTITVSPNQQPVAVTYGPAGPRGPQGIQGPAGQQGPPGATGPAGTTDYNGLTNRPDLTAYAKADGSTKVYARVGAVPPAPASGVTVAAAGTTPGVVEIFGGYVWGQYQGGIYRSADEGGTWSKYCDGPSGTNVIVRIIPTNDGEVICATSLDVAKSSGWASGTVTWSIKVTRNATATFFPFQVDGDGTKFICAQYSSELRADSRYGHISTDGGDTWTQVWDSVARFGQTAADQSHIHGATYDPWNDTFYICEGHSAGGDIAGIYYSTNNGATWTRPPGLVCDPSPTVIVPTDNGLVCGSDSAKPGNYGVVRVPNRDAQVFAQTWFWRNTQPGVVGFGYRGWRDPATGLVYISYKSEFATVVPIITAGTATTAGLVYRSTVTQTTTDGQWRQVVVTPSGKLLAWGSVDSVDYIVQGWVSGQSAGFVDTGGILGGTSSDGTSAAVGLGATVGLYRSTAIGAQATTANSADAVAVGYQASAGNDGAVAVGQGTTTGARAIAVGYQAKIDPTTGNAIAIGASSIVGPGFPGAVALGWQAQGQQAYAVALGTRAVASWDHSVALGADTTATRPFQVAIGARHIEATKLTAEPNNPVAGTARIYWRADPNNTAKIQLVAKFSAGNVVALGTETGVNQLPTYTTAGRPAAATAGAGAVYYDTTVSKPVYSNGTTWADATGTTV